MYFPPLFMEQKPRVIFSPQSLETFGKGWVCYFFEGACVHETWSEAMQCVKKYYTVDMMMAAQPVTAVIQ